MEDTNAIETNIEVSADGSRTGITGYYRNIERGPEPVCAQTGQRAPVACQASQESAIKEALFTGLAVIERILATDLPEQRRLAQILEVLEREFDLVRGTLMLLASTGDTLHVEAVLADGNETGVSRESYRRGEGVTGRVLETGRPAVIPDIADDPSFADRIHRRRERGGLHGVAFLCVPIRLEREVIGTLAADRKSDSPLDLIDAERVLTVVAGLIAHHVQLAREAALHQERLAEENLRLRAALGERIRPENIVGTSAAMRAVYTRVAQIAPTPMTVLIRGDSGTGKELVASAIHYASPRRNRPFVRVHCAALNENLLESELFGHERGAFTGATERRKGRFEAADGGTIFLDEIGDISPKTQVALLRVLQERTFERVGGTSPVSVDVRIIVATNRDLEQMVADGLFREDLYYRLKGVQIELPPLRDRATDIPALAEHFLGRVAAERGDEPKRLSDEASELLGRHGWPGNIRELENVLRSVSLFAEGERLLVSDFDDYTELDGGSRAEREQDAADTVEGAYHQLRTDGLRLRDLKKQVEETCIRSALGETSGNITRAAELLGMKRPRLSQLIKEHGIDVQKS